MIHIDSIGTQQKIGAKMSDVNFYVIKLLFLERNISIKLYAHGYVQVYGIADTFELGASDCAHFLLGFLAMKLSESFPEVYGYRDVKVTALAAFHPGFSESGFGFNLEATEFALRSLDPMLVMSRNARNGSLIVRREEEKKKSSKEGKSGSLQIYTTGTMQLMGVKDDPQTYLELVKRAVEFNSEILIASSKKRKKRSTTLTASVCKMARQLEGVSSKISRLSEDSSSTSTFVPTLRDSQNLSFAIDAVQLDLSLSLLGDDLVSEFFSPIMLL